MTRRRSLRRCPACNKPVSHRRRQHWHKECEAVLAVGGYFDRPPFLQDYEGTRPGDVVVRKGVPVGILLTGPQDVSFGGIYLGRMKG